MKLRNYSRKDSAIICSWIKDEKSLYQWSANRIGKYPLSENALNENYVHEITSDRFIPLSALDDEGNLIGHLLIRYPSAADNRVVRFGFVVINPDLRGSGAGKKMLQLALDYAKNTLGASKVTLGVFANNDNARYCYESVGFTSAGRTEICEMPVGNWECIEMELMIT